MAFFTEVSHNTILISAVMGWLIAQILKTLLHLFFTKSFSAERLIGSGGMPSSHSATVCALATSTCFVYSANSFEFALAFIFALIVMYDAIGVRRETGIQAKVLNEMILVFENMGSNMTPQDKLKEFVGHTPLQVLMGGILGILIAVAICQS